jgi:zinc transport system permease protein
VFPGSLSLLLPPLPFVFLAQAGVEPDADWLKVAVQWVSSFFEPRTFFSYDFNVQAMLALVLVSLNCGMVGSLIVGSRMAFFSDALAHCAFAGVSIGFLVFDGIVLHYAPNAEFWQWVTPIMVGFGILVGFGIAHVRTRTGLTSDTVIGVFFAGAIGLAAMLRKLIHSRKLFNLEDFLFGHPILATTSDIMALGVLTMITMALLAWIYNPLQLASFNSSLAISRRVPVRLVNYLFVMLLALIVNLCLRSVGVLLINALLVVPAATAVNVSRNLRQVFWLSIALCLGVSLLGPILCWEVANRYGQELGIPGTIIMVSVALFVLSMLFGPLIRRRAGRRVALAAGKASATVAAGDNVRVE